MPQLSPPAIAVNSPPVHRILVCYPSGHEFELTGHWLGPTQHQGQVQEVVVIGRDVPPDPRGEVYALDPRGLYLALDTRAVLYNPRWYWEAKEGWVRQFLRANPTWPARRTARFAATN